MASTAGTPALDAALHGVPDVAVLDGLLAADVGSLLAEAAGGSSDQLQLVGELIHASGLASALRASLARLEMARAIHAEERVA